MHDCMPYGPNQGQRQGHSREVDHQSPMGLIFIFLFFLFKFLGCVLCMSLLFCICVYKYRNAYIITMSNQLDEY